MAQEEQKTVLVVDDEPDVRSYLSTILEDSGFRVLSACDGEEALEIVRRKKPDIISLDLVMPRKSGHRMLFELRKDRELSRIPVLIVTAHAHDEMGKGDLQDIMENRVISGPNVYLEKPVQPHDYVRCVQRALGLKETEEAVEQVEVREEIKGLIRGASPDTLRQVLQALRKRKAESGDPD